MSENLQVTVATPMVGYGESRAGLYLADPTSKFPDN